MKWNRNLTSYEVALEKRIAELENLLAEGVHTCSHLCKRPMCVLRREKRELEAKVERLENAIRESLRVHPSYAKAALKAALEGKQDG